MAGQTTLAERLVDQEEQEISLRDIASRLFLRPKLLMLTLLLPPLVAVWFSLMVPTEWSATTKILIRYQNADASLFKDLVPDSHSGLSGATSAELIKSEPVVAKAIELVGITPEDIYQAPMDAIIGGLTTSIKALFSLGGHHASNEVHDAEADKTSLIRSFQASLESSAKKSGSAKGIEVLEKTSTTPEGMKMDELISLQVKSSNREKVATMANGLAQAFIDEYYEIYAKEASKQYDYLNELVKQEERSLYAVEHASPDELDNGSLPSASGGDGSSLEVPILTSMATELSNSENELNKAKQIYDGSSPKVVRLAEQVINLKFQLKKQERIEMVKQQLEKLKTKRFQAANRQKVYEDRLVPISIAEFASTPKPSSSAKVSRVIISAVIGSILALMLATGVMVILNVTDSRIHFERDVQQIISYPVIANIHFIKSLNWQSMKDFFTNAELAKATMPLVAKMGFRQDKQQGKVIVVTSLDSGDGASLIAMTLASTLARNPQEKVCIVDADFVKAGLTQKMQLGQMSGFVDTMLGISPQFAYNQSTNLSAMGVGDTMQTSHLGYYANQAEQFVSHCRQHFTYTVIDVGAAVNNYQLHLLGQQADSTLMIVSSGQARKGKLRAMVRMLEQSGLKLSGVILNKTRNVLPSFLYRSL